VAPEGANAGEALNADGPNTVAKNDGLDHKELASSQEAQLRDAAESLVNHAQTRNTVAVPAVKRKHPGGRPKKIKLETSANGTQFVGLESSQQKRKHLGGRPRKDHVPVDADPKSGMEEEPKAMKARPQKRGGRVKQETVPEDELIQLGEENGVLQSTEQDDGSQYTTSRPTTSSSTATVSTLGSRRSARPQTVAKTNAREARASAARRGSTAVQESASVPASSRNKRKRASPDTDPSPIVVDTPHNTDIPNKKRKTRGKQDSDDIIEAIPEIIPEAAPGRSNKRKRGNTISESIAFTHHAPLGPTAPSKKRRRGIMLGEKEEPEVEAEDSDADIDEESLDPIAREALRKKRVKKEKSRKLSENMKRRWADGGMVDAQETRKANNALKRAHKELTIANEAAGLPPPPPLVLLGTTPNAGQASAPAVESKPEPEIQVQTAADSTPAPAPVTSQKRRTKPRPKPILPQRPASTRTRKPTRAAMGLDGADDEEGDDGSETEQSYPSVYDHFQALTSPKMPILLGKRNRKPLHDLSQLMDSDSVEDEEY
jgi:hypothetical protein